VRSGHAWRAVSTPECGQRVWRGVALNGASTTQALHRRWENELWNSTIAPLHWDLLRKAWKGVLNGVTFGSTVTHGVKVHKQLQDGQKPLSLDL
jgi:hypothetical protein